MEAEGWDFQQQGHGEAGVVAKLSEARGPKERRDTDRASRFMGKSTEYCFSRAWFLILLGEKDTL